MQPLKTDSNVNLVTVGKRQYYVFRYGVVS